MTNQPTSEPTLCGVCGLMLENERHKSAGDCIRGLRKAMMQQRQAASTMAFEISTRYLGVLEELALRPDVGIPYSMRTPGDVFSEEKITLHHQQVAGVFTAIHKKFMEAGDWSPLKERDDELRLQRQLIDHCLDLLSAVFTDSYAVSCDRGELDQLKEIGELARRLGVPAPDPSGLKSRPR